MNANDRITKAMLDNERWILSRIKRDGIYVPFRYGIMSIRLWNAIDRLLDKGKIRHSQKRGGYVMKIKRGEK